MCCASTWTSTSTTTSILQAAAKRLHVNTLPQEQADAHIPPALLLVCFRSCSLILMRETRSSNSQWSQRSMTATRLQWETRLGMNDVALHNVLAHNPCLFVWIATASRVLSTGMLAVCVVWDMHGTRQMNCV